MSKEKVARSAISPKNPRSKYARVVKGKCARVSLRSKAARVSCNKFLSDSFVNTIPLSLTDFALQKNHRLLVNALKKLKTISELEDNWNDNGAKQFEKSLLIQCFNILTVLEKFPPEVFPVADNSIQMEYDGDDDSYLQFRIYEEDIREFCVLSNGEKITKHINSTEILEEVTKFYGRS